ncbi:toll/interleukin-1 receptor domain-containing protein, partial [Flavobacterium sp. YO12]|uniref:toll/interleukin-1 receptor domain-containing protein n=1 Tax=Flavobacterium sp. YO12 TaxID=1920029 RepID=UPI0010257EDD
KGYDADWKIKYEISKAFYEVIDSKVPSDLFISLDGKVFVNAYNLTTFDELKETKISTYDMVSNVVQLDSPKEKAVYAYKIFTNRRLKKMKKVFVSYSHANYKEMEQLTKYLIGFVRNKEIESWTDLKLQSGVKVKDEILQNLEDADIVILLISQDFIASDFIYDYELQMAMQKKITGRGEIIPVVLSSCSIFDLKLNVTGDEGLMNEIKMGDYYFTPQGPNKSLLPIEQWKNESQAWMEVYKDIKKKIKT